MSRDFLVERGVLFPRCVGDFNHTGLAAYAMDDDRGIEELRISHRVETAAELPDFRAKLRKELLNEARASGCHTMVLSNEHCSSRLRKASEISRLRDLCLEICDDVKVVLYIREPGQFYASWYSTAVASGNTFEFPWPIPEHLLRAADWLRLIEDWEKVFGTGSIILRRMDRGKLINGDLLDDFYASIQMPSIPYVVPEPRNEALPLKALIFLRKLNVVLPRIKDGRFNSERGNVVDVLRGWPEKTRFELSRAEQERVRRSFEYSYEKIRQRFFPADESLFSELSAGRDESCRDSQLSQEDLMKLAALLWTSKRNKA